MIKKNFLSSLFFLTSFLLTSCNAFNSSNGKLDNNQESLMVLPTGAPTLATYKTILENKATTLKDASNIPALFSRGETPFIVFDSTKGLNIIKKQGENAKYRFVKMLTGGNFHLLCFNKTLEEVENLKITPENNIYGFQKGNTPDLLFKNVFKEAEGCDFYASNISDLTPKLLSMNNKYEVDGNVLDYAVVAEPASTNIINKLKTKHPDIVIQDINLQTAFKNKHEERNFDYIPQAGLFFRNDLELETPKYQDILTLIESSIDKALNNPQEVIDEIKNAYKNDLTTISSDFGFQVDLIKDVQGENKIKNGFGIVPNKIAFKDDDITIFNSLLTK